MSKITALRARGHSKDRLVVELEEGPPVTVSVDDAMRLALHVGDELDAEALAKLQATGGATGAFDRAVRMLASRGRAAKDLERRLVQKGEERTHAASAVDRLRTAGLLDDPSFARQYVRSRVSSLGRHRLKQELSRQGIAPETAKEAVSEVLADDTVDAGDACLRLAEKRVKSLASLDQPTRRRRLQGFLARRGFSSDEIRRAIAATTSGTPPLE